MAGILYGLQSYYYRRSIGQDVDVWDILFYDASYFILWAIFSPLLYRLNKRFSFTQQTWLKTALIHFGLAIAIAICHRAIYDLFFMPIRLNPGQVFSWDRYFLSVFATFDYGVLVYCIVLFVNQAWDYYQRFLGERDRALKLQAELTTARLQALRSQLHPHFLFNTLNAISVLIREKPEQAVRTVELLGDLLRHSLKSMDQHKISLRRELAFIESYLEIEKTRFGEKLAVEINVNPALQEASVPTFILQPLVENAIRHGISKRREKGEVIISATRIDDNLHLKVQDNGPGIVETNASADKKGIGLANTRQRLATLYGENASFRLENAATGGAIAEIMLPFEMIGQEKFSVLNAAGEAGSSLPGRDHPG